MAAAVAGDGGVDRFKAALRGVDFADPCNFIGTRTMTLVVGGAESSVNTFQLTSVSSVAAFKMCAVALECLLLADRLVCLPTLHRITSMQVQPSGMESTPPADASDQPPLARILARELHGVVGDLHVV